MIFLLNFTYLPTGSKVTGAEQTGGQTDWWSHKSLSFQAKWTKNGVLSSKQSLHFKDQLV
jgi:hypothetical protein